MLCSNLSDIKKRRGLHSLTSLTIWNWFRNNPGKCDRFRRNDRMSGSDNTDRQCCSRDMRIHDSSKCDWQRRMNRQCFCTCQLKTSSNYSGNTRHSLHTWRNRTNILRRCIDRRTYIHNTSITIGLRKLSYRIPNSCSLAHFYGPQCRKNKRDVEQGKIFGTAACSKIIYQLYPRGLGRYTNVIEIKKLCYHK